MTSNNVATNLVDHDTQLFRELMHLTDESITYHYVALPFLRFHEGLFLRTCLHHHTIIIVVIIASITELRGGDTKACFYYCQIF